MNWLHYLLEANLYLIIFYGFYKLFLHKETFYSLNRYYLIFSSILAFILPLFQLGFLKAPVLEQISIEPTEILNPVIINENLPLNSYQQDIFTIDNTIVAIYSLVTLVFFLKMIFSLFKIIRMHKLPSVKLANGVKLIDLNDSKLAFSFFNLLFLDPTLPERNTILKHELVHIKQKHSIDVLFFEILQIVNWFNPITYLIKKDVKLIHEYLADEETTKQHIEKYQYALFLIGNSTGIHNLSFTNQIFNSSVLKKRISMLNQKKSAKWARLKLLIVLPLTGGMLCASTVAFTKDYGIELYANKTDTLQDSTKIKYIGMDKRDRNANLFATDVSISFNEKGINQVSKEKRLIVINGEIIKDNNHFFAASNYEKKTNLNSSQAVEKYGHKAKFGAIELIGNNIKVIQYMPPGSPILKSEAERLPPLKMGKTYTLEREDNIPLVIPKIGEKYFYVTNEKLEKIYSSKEYNDDWDGKTGNTKKFNKKTIKQGTYTYILVITTPEGKRGFQGYIQIQ